MQLSTKFFYALLLLLTLLSVGGRQGLWGQSNLFGTGQLIAGTTNGASDVHAADLDNDGDMDILSASVDDSKIAWYENDGSGNFEVRQVITTEAYGAYSIYATDLDNDGDNDILAGLSGTNQITWYENDGSGNFGMQQIIAMGVDYVLSVYAADLDNDGDMDVLSASAGDDKIAWYENDGSNNFGAQQIITITDYAASVYAADLDNDGDIDVLSASYYDSIIAWYENDGSGNFGAPQILATDVYDANSVYAADLDNDGDIDVLSASVGGDKVAWYENNGSGNFGAQQIIATTTDYAVSVYAADLDNDNDIDVLSASNIEDKIIWYANDGSGNFGVQQVITTALNNVLSVYAADLDNDGDIDVLSASKYDDKIAWYENEGSGNFGAQQAITANFTSKVLIDAADLNNDGNIDVLLADAYKVVWRINNGNNHFGAQRIIANKGGYFCGADIDNDGDIDIVSASNVDGKIGWYENDGNGNFGTEQLIYAITNIVSPIYAADLDNDGDADVLSASVSDNKVAWYENDGNGNFGSRQIIASLVDATAFVYAADLDNDGDKDVISASQNDDQMLWYENNGNGTFGGQQVITTNVWAVDCIGVADIDNDGDMDILFASESDAQITCYTNNGNGDFSLQPTATIETYGAIDIDIADLNNDGYLDLSVASYLNNETYWYANDGSGNFVSQQIIATDVADVRNIQSADLDNDGDIDILSSYLIEGDIENSTIARYENLLNAPQISGYVFYDSNQNGVFDSGEVALDNQSIQIQPAVVATYTNHNGIFRYFVGETGGTYQVSYTAPTGWSATTPTQYNITLAAGESSANNNFGLYPNNLVTDVQPYIASGINRCNQQVPYYLTYVNEGTTFANGTARFTPDPLMTFVSANPAPDSTDVTGTLYWHFAGLPPYQQRQVNMIWQMPDANSTGDTLTTYAYVNSVAVGNSSSTVLKTFAYRPIVLCSFDPNDKQVNPTGIGAENYTLMDEELVYTIRFQNTGNDTAFVVVVRDNLAYGLDWKSFRPITSSHPMQVQRDATGLVTFTFNNIRLVDSTTNEAASHGYILYAIRPNAGLPNATNIENTAYIYFDQNAPVITNTTQNMLVYELPMYSSGFSLPLKVYLQGAYNTATGTMRNDLQTLGKIPLTQPYNTVPWHYYGNEGVTAASSLPANSVDWVLVELRIAGANSIAERRAGILKTDGSVVRPDGGNLLFHNLSPDENYQIVVRHRNHLATRSSSTWNTTQGLYDFTLPVSQSGGSPYQTAIGSVYAMRAGDCNSEGVINRTDYNLYRQAISSTVGYHMADFTLNGYVNSSDFDVLQPNLKAIAPPLIRY